MTLVDILVWYGLNGYIIIIYLILSNLQMFRLQLPVSKRQKGHSWNQQVTLQCADQIIRLHLQLQQFSRHLFDNDPDDPTLHGAVKESHGWGGNFCCEMGRVWRSPQQYQWLLMTIVTIVSYCIILYHCHNAGRVCAACASCRTPSYFSTEELHCGTNAQKCWSYFFLSLVTFFSSDFELKLLSSGDTAVVAVVWPHLPSADMILLEISGCDGEPNLSHQFSPA